MFDLPARIIKGVTVSASGTMADYPASEYDLKVYFVTPGHAFNITATKSGDEFTLTIPKATSDGLAIGDYKWQAFAEDAGQTVRYSAGEGEIKVVADFADMTGGMDGRSVLEQQRAAILAVLSGQATDNQKRVKYGDREVERLDIKELREAIQFLDSEISKEKQAEAIAAGTGFGGKVRVRFNGMV